jgi:hypothetical protein
VITIQVDAFYPTRRIESTKATQGVKKSYR